MSIITYPLDGVTYDAEDVSTYLCTRTSGVYSKDTNYAVSVTGARQITVAPGLAWVNYDDFKGVSACSREAVALTIPDADSTLSRIDRVVLQFDTAANLTAVKLKTGTPAAAPEPPAILQNHNQYELGLCTVSVPAGSSVVTAADITDTRADEDVCGVMRDGVTGIPTAQLVEQWQTAQAAQMAQGTEKLDRLEQSIRNLDNGSFYTKQEADRKFGTPYTLPAATAAQLGGVKVGDYLDIAPDGTLSGKTLYDTIAASVAVKSEPRLVWSGKTTIGRRKTQTINVQDGVDYVNLRMTGGADEFDFNLTPGMSYETGSFGVGSLTVTVLFSADKKRLECTLTNTLNTVPVVFTGYHYPTLADLLTQVTAVESSVADLQVAMCELYEEKEGN